MSQTSENQSKTSNMSRSTSSAAMIGLLLLAIPATLYFAADLLTPIAFAVLLNLLLSPLVRAGSRIGIPSGVSAAVLVGSMIGLLVTLIMLLSEPAERWIAEAPTTVRELRLDMFSARSHLDGIRELADEVEELATPEDKPGTQAVVVRGPGVIESLLGGLPQVVTFLGIVMFTTFFLLASGDTLLRKFTRCGRTWSERRTIVTIAREIQRDLSRYLGTVTLINIGLGASVGFSMYLLEVPNPHLWGVMVTMFNYAPYVGALASAVVLTLVGIATFDTLTTSLTPVAVFLLLTTLEGQLITPTVLGQRLSLNPLFVFLSVIVWGWLWGIAGALMAVPIMTSIKVVCDHVPGLEPVGEFFRGSPDRHLDSRLDPPPGRRSVPEPADG
jgi:predicted PurR-regulated permease PerM